MTETTDRVREHYSRSGLTDRLRTALAVLGPEDTVLSVEQLGPLDQFHTRGMLATKELAAAAALTRKTRVLDVGCGVGGPARSYAHTFGCHVTGVDLSGSFIEAATYLTARCGLSEQVHFEVADALNLPFADGAFDTVFLQHVAMNIADRPALYAAVRRVLAPGGQLATYDLVLREGDVVYPVPWARDATTSFLLSEADTRRALEQTGFAAVLWRDDTPLALEWLNAGGLAPRPQGLSLSLVMGADFPAAAANLSRNLSQGRLGVLSALLRRD
jgi:SAM-dependent methyltransferase